MKFIRVLKADIKDTTNNLSNDIDREYTIEINDFNNYKQEINNELDICKNVIGTELLKEYEKFITEFRHRNSNVNKDISYSIFAQDKTGKKRELGYIKLWLYRDDASISAFRHTNKTHKQLKSDYIDTYEELATYIDEYVTLIVKGIFTF
jgi:hypothetical protein